MADDYTNEDEGDLASAVDPTGDLLPQELTWKYMNPIGEWAQEGEWKPDLELNVTGNINNLNMT